MKKQHNRGVFATEEGVEKLKNAKSNQRNGSGKPWTYADIADAAGLDEKTVGRFLRQEQPIDENSARAICQSLDVDVNEVIDFNSRCKQKDRNGHLDNNDSAFSITGSFEKNKINLAKLKAIEASLRKITGDASLQIFDIEKGSIKLILEGSQEGLERLEQLFKSGELTEILDIPVEEVSFIDAGTSKNDKKRLAFTIAGNANQADIENFKAAFTKTLNQGNTKIDEQKDPISPTSEGDHIEQEGSLGIGDNKGTVTADNLAGNIYKAPIKINIQARIVNIYEQNNLKNDSDQEQLGDTNEVQLESMKEDKESIDKIEQNMISYNVVLLGQTGTGKSSLINYLYGERKAKEGIGKPVTKRENGFEKYDFYIDRMPVSLFDTWGIEIEGEKEWIQDLDNELKRRGIDKPAKDWFHSIFYCISCGTHRIQEYDRKVITKFINDKYKVIILLTKADFLESDEHELLELKDEIQKYLNSLNSSIPIIPVSTRRGKYKEKGKELIESYSYYTFWDSIKLRLPSRCKRVVKNDVNQWKENKINSIRIDIEGIKNNQKIEGFAAFAMQGYLSELSHSLKKDIENYYKELRGNNGKAKQLIDNEIRKTIEMFGEFANKLNYPPDEMNNFLDANISNKIISFEYKGTIEEFISRMNHYLQLTEKDVGGFFQTLGDALWKVMEDFNPNSSGYDKLINEQLNSVLSKAIDSYINDLESEVEKMLEKMAPKNPFEK